MEARRPSKVVIGLGVLVPVVPIVIGVLLTSGGSSSAKAGGSYTPISASSTAATQPHLSATPPNLSPIPPGPGALVATLLRPTMLRATPGGHPLIRLGLRTNYGSPSVFFVARRSGSWLGVLSQYAGNGRLGWIPSAVTTLERDTVSIHVSLSARQVTVVDSGRVLKRYTVAIGRPTAPTPTGRFAVTDRLATGDPAGPYGCCIIALTATSPHAIQGWGGGNRIAIHSTPETSTIGDPVSHGCMRLTIPEAQWLMYHIPLGTPTLISG